MEQSKIKVLTANRDQIERLRDIGEELFQTAAALTEIDGAGEIVDELFQLSAALTQDVYDIRERNGVTIKGVEQDPPSGYEAPALEATPNGHHVHRICRRFR